MLNVTSLRNAITQQLADAESKRILVDSLMKTAQQHAASGDYARAQLDRDSAERYLRDINAIEKTIADYESEIMKREQKAKEIDRRIDDLNKHFEHDLEQLEKEKGYTKTAILTLPEAEVIKRQLKNKGINNKEDELKKHYKHELQKLIDEQKSVLG